MRITRLSRRHPHRDDGTEDDLAVSVRHIDFHRHLDRSVEFRQRLDARDGGQIGRRFCEVFDRHAFRNPAIVARHGHFGHRSCCQFSQIADSDSVHGADVVLHGTALLHRDDAVGGSQRFEAATDAAKIGRLPAYEPRKDTLTRRLRFQPPPCRQRKVVSLHVQDPRRSRCDSAFSAA